MSTLYHIRNLFSIDTILIMLNAMFLLVRLDALVCELDFKVGCFGGLGLVGVFLGFFCVLGYFFISIGHDEGQDSGLEW